MRFVLSPRLRATFVLLLGLVAMPPSAANALTSPFHGHLQYETFGYPQDKSASPVSENFFELSLRGAGAFTPGLRWSVEGRAVADDIDFTAGGFSPRNGGRRRPYVSLISGAIDYLPTDTLRLSVGKQILNWSIMDGVQPGNVLAPSDDSDPFRSVREGVYGISTNYTGDQAAVDFIVVPLAFTPSRLPQGRWRIIRDDVAEQQDLPPVRLDETQAGLRVSGHLDQLEMSLFGYVGRDFAAMFVPKLIFVGGDPPFELQIEDVFPRLRAFGLTLSQPLGDSTLVRAESVYFNSPDRNRADFILNSAAAEYAIDDWRIVLSYLRDDTVIAAHEKVTNEGARRFFKSFLASEARYDDGQRWRTRFRAGYDVRQQFLLLEPEISLRTDWGIEVALVAELIWAWDNSYFGSVAHEDRIGSRLAYVF